MIVPNKVVRIDQSAIGLAPLVLAKITRPMDLLRLYDYVDAQFEDINQFILTIDVLYLLGRIDIDLQTRVVTLVDRN